VIFSHSFFISFNLTHRSFLLKEDNFLGGKNRVPLL